MVAFGFLPQHFGRWQGPTNAILLLYEWSLSGVDNQISEDTETILGVKEIF